MEGFERPWWDAPVSLEFRVSGWGFQLVLTEEDGVAAATYIVKKVLDSWCGLDVIFVELQVSVIIPGAE